MATTTEAPRPHLGTDLETGAAQYGQPGYSLQNRSVASLSVRSGIGPALSSNGTSIMGSENGGPGSDEWGPQHPCFPHLNPHVPLNSTEYKATRIIRVRRDWMVAGDLAPTFSNLYPEILDPAGLNEGEFRRVIQRLNEELVALFNPWSWRNIIDVLLGLLTGWLWDDLGFTWPKRRLQALENWIEEWNYKVGHWDGESGGVRIVPLRRTAYMNLDIQIPDPEISFNPESVEGSKPPTADDSMRQ